MAALNFSTNQRRDRFFTPPKFTKSFAEVTEKGSAFLNTWETQICSDRSMLNALTNQHLTSPEIDLYDVICDNANEFRQQLLLAKVNEGRIKLCNMAADGILAEGTKLGKLNEAEQIADHLRSAGSMINQVCIKLYTDETFLYHQLNRALRENDFSQVPTLGPYAYALYQALINSNYMVHNTTVYRGTCLTTEMIEEYKSSVGEIAKWLGFSSTSRNRQSAEGFSGNALFIIDIKQPVPIDCGYDLSALSQFPQEEEVLLLAGGRFKIENIEFDSENDKYFIYLTIF